MTQFKIFKVQSSKFTIPEQQQSSFRKIKSDLYFKTSYIYCKQIAVKRNLKEILHLEYQIIKDFKVNVRFYYWSFSNICSHDRIIKRLQESVLQRCSNHEVITVVLLVVKADKCACLSFSYTFLILEIYNFPVAEAVCIVNKMQP